MGGVVAGRLMVPELIRNRSAIGKGFLPLTRQPEGTLEMSKLTTLLASTTGAALLTGFAQLAGSNVVEQAPAGSGYDLVAHLSNRPTYGYNPEVPTDTAALGLRLAKQYCRGPQVVGQRGGQP
jgi:hypothetical protein